MNSIDKIRKIKGLSYNDIGKMTGITATYIQMIAKGKRKNPSFDVMQKIALALEEKVEKVFQLNKTA